MRRNPAVSVGAVLTDYHLHLRPDDPEAAADDYYTGENVDHYLAAAEEHGIDQLGVSEHVYRFSAALQVWDHPFWRGQAVDDIDAYCEFVRTTPLRLGIEMDFVAGAEDRIANLLEARPFDYVIGSVHFITGGAVDDEDYDVWDEVGDPDGVWRRYFQTLAEAARSGLFDVLAHPDLVKVWGRARPLPERDPRFYYEPAVEAIAESGIAVEVSTAGLRKPVEELYPSRAFAEMCIEAGAQFALSSDAHSPEHVGYGYDRALDYLAGLEVGEICVFENRRRRLEPLRPAATVEPEAE
jgi:histidinol-phosphatase (PHP family)